MQVARGLNEPVDSLEYLSSVQLEQFAAWNATGAEFHDTTLHGMFEKEASQKPDKIAVVVVVVVLINVHGRTGVARSSTTSLGVLGRAKLWNYVQ